MHIDIVHIICSFFDITENELYQHLTHICPSFSSQSTGDYYSCANLSGAPIPTAGIISRGIAAEGLGVIMSGLWGTSCGTTSYAENIGAIALTGVGSRAVVSVWSYHYDDLVNLCQVW